MVVVVVGGEVGRKAIKINCLIYLSLFRLIVASLKAHAPLASSFSETRK